MILTQLPWLWDNIHRYPSFFCPSKSWACPCALPPQALASFLPPFAIFRQRTALPCGNAAPCPSPPQPPRLPLSSELPLSDQGQLCVTAWQVQSKQTKWILTRLCVCFPTSKHLRGGGVVGVCQSVCESVCSCHSMGRVRVQGGTWGGLEL